MPLISNFWRKPKYQSKRIDVWVTKTEWVSIQKGFTPQSMDDKWVILYRDGFLNFVRSWGDGHIIFKTCPRQIEGKLHFSTLYCRRNIKKYYNPNSSYDESEIVEGMIKYRIKTPQTEPWFGWDPRYPKETRFLEPDFSEFKTR